jgi:predicted PurR-regulated permease PerM
MGNVVEPIVMGDRNKINTVTILFGLVFWGFIWGIPGMILSVPLLVTMKMIFEQFDTTSTFARIMGSPD